MFYVLVFNQNEYKQNILSGATFCSFAFSHTSKNFQNKEKAYLLILIKLL